MGIEDAAYIQTVLWGPMQARDISAAGLHIDPNFLSSYVHDLWNSGCSIQYLFLVK